MMYSTEEMTLLAIAILCAVIGLAIVIDMVCGGGDE